MTETVETETACYLCGAPATPLEAGGIAYWRCRHCGLIIRRDRETDSAEVDHLYGAEYYANPETYPPWDTDPHLRHVLERRVATVSALMPARGALLDVGSGLGHFMAAAQDDGWIVAGVDPSTYARQMAEQRTGAPVYSDISMLPPDMTWDCVTLWDVLEHDADPLALAARVGRLMMTGGLLAVSMPNSRGLEARLRGRSWRFFRPEYGHITHHSIRTLSLLLQRAGFTVIRAETEGSLNVRRRLAAVAPVSVSEGVQNALDGLTSSAGLGRNMTVYARRSGGESTE